MSVLFAVVGVAAGIAGAPPLIPARAAAVRGLSALSPGFAEVPSAARGPAEFRLFSPGGSVHLGNGSIRFDAPGEPGRALALEFCNGNPAADPVGVEPSGTRVHLIEGDEKEWQTRLRTFGGVLYPHLWPGIDLVCREGKRGLKYEFRVAPGAAPAQIRLRYRGGGPPRVNHAGQLEATTGNGRIVDDAPVAWQERAGRRIPVACAYGLDGSRHGFELGAYDPALPLVIDPAVIVYSGYVGGDAGSWNAMDVAVDTDGAAYVAAMIGFTNGFFLAKVLPDGTGLEWFAQYAGPYAPPGPPQGRFFPWGIAVDGQGRAVVCGVTDGPLPVRTGPDTTFNGSTDAFVSRFAADGTLDYAGYVGGVNGEEAYHVAVDSDGAAYVVGETNSNEGSFPAAGGFDGSYNGGTDAFLAKVLPDGTGLEYCTYIGGTGYDRANGIGVDPAGRACISGFTDSREASGPVGAPDFPVRVGPDTSYNGGLWDAFVARFDPAGADLEYCGYIGGSGMDVPRDAAVHPDGSLFLGGFTDSPERSGPLGAPDFPVQAGPDLSYNGGDRDAFVARVLSDGSLAYCGYIGGARNEEIYGVGVDAAGRLAVAGWTGSDETTFPVREGPDLTHNGGGAKSPNGPLDVFVASVTASGSRLRFCGYIGGSGDDGPNGATTGPDGAVYACGFAGGPGYPAVGGPDLDPGGGTLTKVVLLPAAPAGLGGSARGSTVTRLVWTHDGAETTHYRVERREPDGPWMNAGEFPSAIGPIFYDLGLRPDRLYTYRVFAKNEAGLSDPSGEITLHTLPVMPPTLTGGALSATSIRIELVPSGFEADGYRLERRDAPGAAFQLIAAPTPDEIAYTDTGLRPGTTYTYRAVTILGTDTGPFSDEVSLATNPLEPPVLLEVAAGGTDSLRLVWVDRSLEERAFVVEHSLDGFTFGLLATVDGSVGDRNTLTYLHQELQPGSTHTYRIQALIEEDMVSPYSNVLSGTTREVASPSRLTSVPLASTRVQLSWTDNSDDEDGFFIERAENADPSLFAMVHQLVGRHRTNDPVTWTDTMAAAGTLYAYRVRAYRESDDSTYSNTAVCTTPPALAAPTGLRAERVGKVMRITFRDASDAAEGYAVFARQDGAPGRAQEPRLPLVARGAAGQEIRVEHRLGRAPLAPAAMRWQFRVAGYRRVHGRREWGPSSGWAREQEAHTGGRR